MRAGGKGLTEFEIISRYFSDIQGSPGDCSPDNKSPGKSTSPSQSSPVVLGVGDDCALLSVPEGQQLALSIDTLVAGRHFPDNAQSFDVAQRALAVAISDLAAMGACPLAFTLALTLPTVDPSWLDGFSKGLRQAAEYYQIPLIGGDMTQGPLSVTLQVHGTLPFGSSLRRSGARPSDGVFVTGNVGDAAAALAMFKHQIAVDTEQQQFLHSRFYTPQARVELGETLLAVATAAIDISDGLLADLGHICKASGVAAKINSEKLPLSPVLMDVVDRDQALKFALTGGDDYELCFTAPAQFRTMLVETSAKFGVPVTEIGQIEEGEGVVCVDGKGQRLQFAFSGYQHFQ
ncbi:MAG: thiamine-phosphate kinase [Pseudomonadales bacterium]